LFFGCFQVLKKRSKEVQKEMQQNKKKNRRKEDKDDRAAEEVLSGDVEWEVYFNKASFFLSMKYVEAGLEAVQQALLALERDTQMAKKKYSSSNVLKCYKTR